MNNYTVSLLGSLLIATIPTLTYAAGNGKVTLPAANYLKDTKGNAVGYFKSDVLRTSQENIATGVHDFEIRLPDDALFSIRADNKVINPGSTLQVSKELNNGILQFEVAPLTKKDIGKVEYEVYIPSLYSIDDRFWEVFDPTYTPWVDSGQNIEHESWLPPLDQQMTDFTQTRKYKDVYTRERQDRDKDTNVGEIRNNGEPVTEYDYRAATESRDVKASVDAYVNTGELHDCGEWVPPASETYEGFTVDQTYTCQQDQTRTWTYKVGSEVIGTHPQLQSIDDIKYQTVPGSKNPWLSTASVFGEWTNVDDPYSYTSWDPAIFNQTSNFTQSRSYKQNQTRTEQKQQKNAVTGEIRNVGALQDNSRIKTVDEQRTIAVSVSGWSNSGDVYSCSAWSPDTGTVAKGTAFTQTRNCSQMLVRTWSYKDGSTIVTTRNENLVSNASPTRTATGTKIVSGKWVTTTVIENVPQYVMMDIAQQVRNQGYQATSTNTEVKAGATCSPIGLKKYTASGVYGPVGFPGYYVRKHDCK